MLHNQGKTEVDYRQLLSLPQWKAKRKQILHKDNRMCRNCGSKNFLQVHHRQYHVIKCTGKFKDPWNYDEVQLITLCNYCHENGHHYYKIPVFIVNK
jgi:5-methylcytosine-specific restriction endonuclease McrA